MPYQKRFVTVSDTRQMPHQKSAKFHIKNQPNATSKTSQVPHQKSAKCHIKNRPNATSPIFILLIF
jgi:hypothetical protein